MIDGPAFVDGAGRVRIQRMIGNAAAPTRAMQIKPVFRGFMLFTFPERNSWLLSESPGDTLPQAGYGGEIRRARATIRHWITQGTTQSRFNHG